MQSKWTQLGRKKVPIKCQAQYVKNILILFLTSTPSAEIICKISMTNTPRMGSYNTMPHNNANNGSEHASLEFKQSCREPSIQQLAPYL